MSIFCRKLHVTTAIVTSVIFAIIVLLILILIGVGYKLKVIKFAVRRYQIGTTGKTVTEKQTGKI